MEDYYPRILATLLKHVKVVIYAECIQFRAS